MKHTAWSLLLGSIALVIIACESPLRPTPEWQPLVVEIDSAVYVPASAANKYQEGVRLTWKGPEDRRSFDFYNIYRTSVKKADGEYDTTTLATDNLRSVIDPNVTSYTDIPSLNNTTCLYAIRAVDVKRHVDNYGTVRLDTVYGSLTDKNMRDVKVGSDVGFNIANSNLYTKTRECSLMVVDPIGSLASVKFTQIFHTYLVTSSGSRTEVNFNDPANPPDSATISALIAAKLLGTDGKLGTDVASVDDVPDFEASDPDNMVREKVYGSTGKGGSSNWVLKSGNGTKRAWARVVTRAGLVDTLSDQIEITPWRVQLYLRNKMNAVDATMRKEKSSGATNYYVYKPSVDFSVSVFADPTINEEFDCWVMVPYEVASVYEEIRDKGNAVIETVPRKFKLTGGGGAAHDDAQIYTYSLDTFTTEGIENIERFRYTFQVQSTALAFKLRDDDFGGIMNLSSVPGSYWGPAPSIYNSLSKTVVPKYATIELPRAKMADRLRYLRQDQLQTRGVKEFVVITRFTGKSFGDTRVAVSGGELMPGSSYANRASGASSYFDLYPPNCNARSDAGIFINNGTVINTPTFSFAPAVNPSIEDKGRAKVVSVKLVIARKPSTDEWKVIVGGGSTAETMTLAYLNSLRSQEFPFDIKVSASSISGVSWMDIDASNWPSGDYYMGVVASDEFGNEGFSPIGAVTSSAPYTNPWVTTILTGK